VEGAQRWGWHRSTYHREAVGYDKEGEHNKVFSLSAKTLYGIEIRPDVFVNDDKVVDVNWSVSIVLTVSHVIF
jgi:hypothetical protein